MIKAVKKELAYSLIVSDFDGTLVSDDGHIPQENKEAITEYCANGGKFAISTGRMHYTILPRVKELGLNGPVFCGNGTLIVDAKTGEIIFSKVLPPETIAQICKKIEELDLLYVVYAQTVFYANKATERLARHERVINFKAVVVEDRPLSQFVRENKISAYKVVAFVKAEEQASIMDILSKSLLGTRCEVTKSGDTLVELINPSYSKGTALEFLANYFAVPLKKTIAVGDQWNDISMIEKAGLGVAVKNADEKLKAKSLVLDVTNEEAAVAKLIKSYAYSNENFGNRSLI